jgi:hypothetical protein
MRIEIKKKKQREQLFTLSAETEKRSGKKRSPTTIRLSYISRATP